MELIEQLVDEMDLEAETAVIDVYHDALIETGRIANDSLQEFKVIESVGRVVLVQFTPYHDNDPIMPICLGSCPSTRKAAREFLAVMYKWRDQLFHQNATSAAARYLSACQWLNGIELAYLEKQLQLCAVDPQRRLSGSK